MNVLGNVVVTTLRIDMGVAVTMLTNVGVTNTARVAGYVAVTQRVGVARS